jgi:phosphomethylpyrimidine synthase
MCGPKFCSMRITQDIRDAMDQKSEEFAEHDSDGIAPHVRGRVYLPLSS